MYVYRPVIRQPNKFVNIYPKRKCKKRIAYRVTFKYKTNFSGDKLFNVLPENFNFDIVNSNKSIESGDLVRYLPKRKHQNKNHLARVIKIRRRRKNVSTGQNTNNQYILRFNAPPVINGEQLRRVKTSDISELKLVPEVEAYFCAADYISGGDMIKKYEYVTNKTRKKKLKKKIFTRKNFVFKNSKPAHPKWPNNSHTSGMKGILNKHVKNIVKKGFINNMNFTPYYIISQFTNKKVLDLNNMVKPSRDQEFKIIKTSIINQNNNDSFKFKELSRFNDKHNIIIDLEVHVQLNLSINDKLSEEEMKNDTTGKRVLRGAKNFLMNANSNIGCASHKNNINSAINHAFTGGKRTRRKIKKRKQKKTRKRKIPTNTVENIWGKNKKLEKFWSKLASGREVILVNKNDKKVNYKLPKTHPALGNKYRELEEDGNIKAIITSAQSSDIYESLYKRVKNKTPKEIIKNYKKYLIKDGKTWYL